MPVSSGVGLTHPIIPTLFHAPSEWGEVRVTDATITTYIADVIKYISNPALCIALPVTSYSIKKK